jgi:DNA-binding MarR family transcriptional regulator
MLNEWLYRVLELADECQDIDDLNKVATRVSSELGIDPEQVCSYGKHPLTVKARSLFCYWAVRKLGFSATELSKKLGVSQPTVSISVKRGEKIAKAEQ